MVFIYCFAVLSLAVKYMRHRGSRFGCPTNASLYSFVMDGAVKAGASVGSVLFRGFRIEANR